MRIKPSRESSFLSKKKSIIGPHYPRSPNPQSSKKQNFATHLAANLILSQRRYLTFLSPMWCACPCRSDDTLTDWITGAVPAPATGAKEHPDFWIQNSEMHRGTILLYSVVHESKKLWDRFMKRGCRCFSSLMTMKSLAGSRKLFLSFPFPFLPPSSFVNQ